MRLSSVFACAIEICVFCCLALGCGGPSPETGRNLAPEEANEADLSVQTGVFSLPAPSELKLISAAPFDRELTAEDCVTELIHPNVNLSSGQAQFLPDFDPLTGHYNLAFAYYRFSVAEHADEVVLSLDWAAAWDWGDLFVGVANVAGDYWEWRTTPAGQALSISDVADRLGAADDMLLAVVLTGDDQWVLDGLTLADYLDGRAVLAVQPPVGVYPLEITLDASASQATESIVAYEWDAEGDGAFVGGGPEQTYTTVIEDAGSYHAQVRVTYNDGSLSLARAEYTVLAERNLSLVPDPEDTNWESVYGSGTEESPFGLMLEGWAQELSFEALDQPGGTGDPIDPAELEWLVSPGDAVFVSWSNPAELSLLAAGECVVFARDATGQETNLVYFEIDTNEPPVASFTADPLTGNAPLTVTFDASESADPDNSSGMGIQWLEWDFDGDGAFDLKQHCFYSVTGWTYHQPGTYDATLKVTDYEGGTDEAVVQIEVLGNPEDPYWHLTRVVGPTEWLDYVTLQNIDGRPAIAYTFEAAASDPGLMYLRAQDAFGTAWDTPMLLHSYDVPFFAALDLAVVGGKPAIAYITEEGLELAQLRFIAAEDATGGNWAANVEVDENLWLDNVSLADIGGVPAIAYEIVENGSGAAGVYYTCFDGVTAPSGWAAPVLVESLLDIGEFNPLALVDGRPAISLARYVDYYDERLVFNRANDATGTDWSSPVVVDGTNNAGAYSSLQVVGGNPAISYLDRTDNAVKYVRATDAQGSAWGTPVTIANEALGIEPGLLTSLLVTGDGPAALFEGLVLVHGGVDTVLCYAAATDATGSDWTTPKVIWGQPGTMGIDSTIVDGRPTIAFLSWENELGSEIWVGMLY
ncbi:PKD domain-containing protein [bacterium]|nr:PKD domain-containing protein [bacterium]